MGRACLAETLDAYGHLLWEVDGENAPAAFEELYGVPAPAGLTEAALVKVASRSGSARAPMLRLEKIDRGRVYAPGRDDHARWSRDRCWPSPWT